MRTMIPEAPDHRRRRLLQALGGALAIPALPALARPESVGQEFSVGAVLPRSRHWPGLGRDFLLGLRLGLDEAGLPGVRLDVTEYAGDRPSHGIAELRALAARSDLQLLTGVLPADAGPGLVSLLAEHERPLLLCEAGANLPPAENPAGGGYVASETLGYWQSNQAAATWAATGLGRRGVLVSGFRESGYDLPYVFREAFERAGGELLGQRVAVGHGGGSDFQGVAELVRATRPDFVHALFSGVEADAFLAYYQGHALHRIAPLLGGGFLKHDRAQDPGASVLTAATWSRAEAACTPWGLRCQAAGIAPAPFIQLGWQAGQRLGNALRHGGRDGAALATALGASPAIAGTAAAARAHWLRQGSDERVLASLPAGDRVPQRDVLRSGWAYSYLAA